MEPHPPLEPYVHRRAFADFRWLHPADLVVAEWVRMKCRFGCPDFGRAAACPPNTPEVEACRRFFAEYAHGLIFHFEVPALHDEERRAWSVRTNRALVDLERDVFLAGYPRAFALFTDACHLCESCMPERAACKEPASARPSATAMAVDVFGSARRLGYPIQVLTDTAAPADYFAFLLVE
jgi:predicted metal-binding protein